MGLTLHVFRSSLGDCSNGGISGSHDEVCCVNVDGPFVPSPERPAVALVAGNGANGCTVRVIPVEPRRMCVQCGALAGDAGECSVDGLVGPHTFVDGWADLPGGVGPMMGGTYVGTSDSRFTAKIEEMTGQPFYGAVAFHDRYETTEQ